MKVQIYEIQEPLEAETVIEAGVDHIGSVLLSESEWQVPSVKETVQVVRDSGCISSVIPLFSTVDAICRVIDFYRPDVIHFCESLTEGHRISSTCTELIELQRQVKQRFPEVSVMRSIPIAPTGAASLVPTLDLARMFEPVSDLFLTDTLMIDAQNGEGDQPVSGFVGITGKTCDWEMAGQLVRQSSLPVILAGGLSPENVYDGAVEVVPAGVDSCTQTNMCDSNGKPLRFRKDINKVKRFVREARRAELEIQTRLNIDKGMIEP